MQSLITHIYSLCLLLIVSGGMSSAIAQEINFGDFSNQYSVSITELNVTEDLNFGTVLQNEGLKVVEIYDSKVLAIEGIKYLDVIIDITAENYLYLDSGISCNASGTDCIPFTLKAAYANQGSNNFSDAVIMQTNSNIASAQFPILTNVKQPPGPPPTPDYEGYNPALYNATAYLYIYGAINVGNEKAGSYSGEITISVSYD